MSVARSEFYCVPQRLNEFSRQSAWNIARRGCSISYVLIYNLIGFQCFTKQNSHDQLLINDWPKIFFGYRTSSHFQLMKAFLNSFKWGQKSIINLQIMKAFGVKSVHMYAILGYIYAFCCGMDKLLGVPYRITSSSVWKKQYAFCNCRCKSRITKVDKLYYTLSCDYFWKWILAGWING